jgi:hypothetical protein
MEYDNRLLKLSRYVKQTIEESGLKLHPFHKRYGYDRENKAIISATTFRGLVNDPKTFPDKKTFDGLSVILSKAKGHEVPASELMKICDLAQPEYDEVGDFSQPIDDAPTRADLLIRQYQSLPYFERSRISPDLLHQIADDNEYATLDDTEQVAWLVKREKARQAMGTATFAKEFVGVSVEIVEAILRKEQIKLTRPQFLALASRVHDVNGKLLLNEDEARRSLFARVLAPQLFIESD